MAISKEKEREIKRLVSKILNEEDYRIRHFALEDLATLLGVRSQHEFISKECMHPPKPALTPE